MFKELDTIYLVDANKEEMILAKKKDGIWACLLCNDNVDRRGQMLDHVRFHILVK